MAQTKNSDKNSQDSKVAFGVEALIERLRNEGVGSGRAEVRPARLGPYASCSSAASERSVGRRYGVCACLVPNELVQGDSCRV